MIAACMTGTVTPRLSHGLKRFEAGAIRMPLEPVLVGIHWPALNWPRRDGFCFTVPVMHAAIITTNSYQMFLGKLGYRVEVVKQIHENDCYSRLGPKAASAPCCRFTTRPLTAPWSRS